MNKKIVAMIVLSVLGLCFINGCTLLRKKEPVKSTEVVEEIFFEQQPYGIHTNDIQVLLDATPIGSEISIEEGKDGSWYLKIEKVFTAENLNTQELDYVEEPLQEKSSSETMLI